MRGNVKTVVLRILHQGKALALGRQCHLFLGFGAPRSTAFEGAAGEQDRGDEYGDDQGFADDHDEYVEYTVSWDDAAPVTVMPADAEPDTEPMASRAPQVLHAPASLG